MFHVLTTHPVHKADIRQHEEVDLDKKPSLCGCIGRNAPNGNSKSMQEAHVEKAWGLCRDVGVYRLPQRRARSAYNISSLYPRLCMLCLSCRKALAPMLPWCSVIVVAVALAEVDHRVLRAGRDQPRTKLIGTAESSTPVVKVVSSSILIAYRGRARRAESIVLLIGNLMRLAVCISRAELKPMR